MPNNDVKFTDNSAEVLKLFGSAKHRGLVAIGMTAETYAKETLTVEKAVDTGRLRNSVTYAVAGYEAGKDSYGVDPGKEGEGGGYSGTMPGEKDEAVYIGSNVFYAPYIEEGTRKMAARPFIKPAALNHSEEYKELMKKSMENA